MEKQSSILDYVRSGLDPAVFGADGFLLPEHHKQITETLASFLTSSGFTGAESWIQDVKLVGSLTTYQYTSTTDVDIHVPVDLAAFIKAENSYLTEQDANDLLDALRKKFNPEKTTLANTAHPIELYFETPINRKTQPARTGAYSLLENKWTLPPVSVDVDFDIEDISPMLVDIAEEIASELDIELGALKRDVLRGEELVEVIKSWEPEKQTKFKAKLAERLTKIEQEISALILKKDDIADARKKYDPESEQEITFKYLQRFGYFAIISALKELVKDDGKVTPDELPVIEKILDKEAAVKPKVVPVETFTIGGKTIKVVVGQEELDGYLNSIKNMVDGEDGVYIGDYDSERQVAHDAALESALQLTDFQGEDPYLFASNVREAISRFAEDMFSEKYGSLKKTAEVIQINNWGTIIKNPTADDAEDAFNASPDHQLRWGATGSRNLYIWNAGSFTHHAAAQYLKVQFGYANSDSGYLGSVEEARDWANRYEADRYERTKGRKAASLDYTAEFTPSMSVMPPNSVGPDNVVTPVDPDHIHDDQTLVNPDLDKPRNSGGFWRSLIDWFTHKKEKKAAFELQYWIDPNGQEYEGEALKQEGVTPEKLIRQGWVQVLVPSDRQGVVLIVDELEFTPDHIDAFLNKTVGYGDPVTVKDLHGTTMTFRFPFKHLKWLIKKQLNAPDQVVSSLNKKASAARGWLDPKGKFFNFGEYNYNSFDGETHSSWARNNEQMLYKEYSLSGLKGAGDPTRKLIENGWVRISDDEHRLTVQLLSLTSIPSFVDEHLKSYVEPGTEILFEDKNYQHYIEVSDWEEGVQQAVNKELAQQQAVKRQVPVAASVKQAGLYRGWLSPDGEFHELGSEYPTHDSWINDNFDLLANEYGIALPQQELDTYSGDPDDRDYEVNVLDELGSMMFSNGWARVGDIHADKATGIEVDDIHSVDQNVVDFIQALTTDKIVIEDGGGEHATLVRVDYEDVQHSIERDLQTQRMSRAASLKQAELSQKYWITPEGTFIPLNGETHPGWIQTHSKDPRLEKFVDIYDSSLLLQDAWNIIPGMLEAGWVRVTIDESKYQFGIEVNDLMHLPPFIDQIIDKFYDDKNSKPVALEDTKKAFVDVTDPFPSLQEVVNNIYRPRKAASLITASASSEILKLINETGGASYNLQQGNLAGTETYAVSIYPNRSVILDHTPTEQEIDAYLNENKDILSGDTSFGAWTQTGKTYLDIVVTLHDKEQAIALGKQHNQIAIFDLKNFVEIPTGGTGEPVKESSYGPDDGFPKEYYTHNTDDKNLGNPNQRFMGRPKGPNRSNQEEVIQMIFEKPLSRRHAELQRKAFTANGFWVAPDGKAYDVRKSGASTHPAWVLQNASLLDKKYGIKDAGKSDYYEVAAEMLSNGWARVGDSGRNKFATVGVEIHNIKSIPAGVEDVLATFLQDGDTVVVADLAGDWAEVTYPFKSLQNAVRRALKGSLVTADYTPDQNEAIFTEQHEFNDNSGLATTPHEFTHSSNDYPSPKDIQPVQVFLDKLDKRKTPPIASYEVSWAISQPKE